MSARFFFRRCRAFIRPTQTRLAIASVAAATTSLAFVGRFVDERRVAFAQDAVCGAEESSVEPLAEDASDEEFEEYWERRAGAVRPVREQHPRPLSAHRHASLRASLGPSLV